MLKLLKPLIILYVYLRVLLLILWLAFCSFLISIMALFRWRDPNLNWYFVKLFSIGALWLMGVRILSEGIEHQNANHPCVFVANHQTAFDVVSFGSIGPKRTIIIGKRELIWIPFYGILFVACGNILIDRSKRTQALNQLTAIADKLKNENLSIWAFPEGTRNRTQQTLLPFKKGPFLMAIRAGIPIVPVISAPFRMIKPLENPFSQRKLKMKFLTPISTLGYSDKDADKLASHTRKIMLEALEAL